MSIKATSILRLPYVPDTATYRLDLSATAIHVAADGAVSPTGITIGVFRQGTDPARLTLEEAGMYAGIGPAGGATALRWPSSSVVFPVSGASALDFTLVDTSTGTVHDRVSVPVVTDGKNGEDGKAYGLVLSHDTVARDAAGMPAVGSVSAYATRGGERDDSLRIEVSHGQSSGGVGFIEIIDNYQPGADIAISADTLSLSFALYSDASVVVARKEVSFYTAPAQLAQLVLTPLEIVVDLDRTEMHRSKVYVDMISANRYVSQEAFGVAVLTSGGPGPLDVSMGPGADTVKWTFGAEPYTDTGAEGGNPITRFWFMFGSKGSTPVDATIPVTVTYGGLVYNAQIRYRTRPEGRTVVTRPPAMWADYPVGYAFDNGDSGYIDTVYDTNDRGDVFVCSCRVAHAKGADDASPCREERGDSARWSLAAMSSLTATRALYAQTGYVESLTAGGIHMIGRDGRVAADISDGDVFLRGCIEATSGQFGNLRVRGNEIVAVDEDGNAVAHFGVADLPDINGTLERHPVLYGKAAASVPDSGGSNQMEPGTVNNDSNGIYVSYYHTSERWGHARAVLDIPFTVPEGTAEVRVGRPWRTFTADNNTAVAGTWQSCTVTLQQHDGGTWRDMATGTINEQSDDITFAGLRLIPSGEYRIHVTAEHAQTRPDAEGVFSLGVTAVWHTAVTVPAGLYLARNGIASVRSATNYMLHTDDRFTLNVGGRGFTLYSDGRVDNNGFF